MGTYLGEQLARKGRRIGTLRERELRATGFYPINHTKTNRISYVLIRQRDGVGTICSQNQLQIAGYISV